MEEELGRIDVEREDEWNKEETEAEEGMEVVNRRGRVVERGDELKKQENGVE